MKIEIITTIILIILLILVIVWIIEIVRYNQIHSVSDDPEVFQEFDNKYTKLPHVTGGKSRYVISLTSIPDRINLMGPAIASLYKQNVRVDEIVINIPYTSRKGDKYVIPEWMKNLNYLKIHRVEKDVGPGTKILPTLQRESNNTRIIVVDDDVIYNSSTIKKLANRYEKNKGCAITNFGIKLQHNGQLPTTYDRVMSFVRSSREVDLLQGFSGFLVTPKMFPVEVFDHSIGPPEAISVDDIWLSGWLKVNGIKIKSVGKTIFQLPLVNLGDMRTTTALGKSENVEFIRDNLVIQWFIENYNVFKY